MRPSVAFIDALALMLLILVLLPTRPDIAASDESRTGTMVAEAHWPDGSHADVDLWVQSPDDKPVGYSRLRGNYFSLFRDDLGTDYTSQWRYEITAARGTIRDGEYVFNLHLFSDGAAEAPIPVDVVVWYKTPRDGRLVLWRGVVMLRFTGEEVTAVRFRMQNEALLPGSLHHTLAHLRAERGRP